MIYRQAQLSDLEALRATELKVIEAERPFNSAIKDGAPHYYDIAKLISDTNTQLLVVEDKGKIIGTGYAQIRASKASLQHDIHAYLGFMYVATAYRGKGLNAEITQRLITWGRSQGAKDFYLDVYSNNSAAIRAYQKVGFNACMIEMKMSVE